MENGPRGIEKDLKHLEELAEKAQEEELYPNAQEAFKEVKLGKAFDPVNFDLVNKDDERQKSVEDEKPKQDSPEQGKVKLGKVFQ